MPNMTENNTNQTVGQGGGVSRQQTPIFQASPSGGVVATLQPGQTGFEGQVRSESDRTDGFVLQDSTAQSTGGAVEGLAMPQMSSQPANFQSATTTNAQKTPPISSPSGQTPKSVRNFRVGAQRSAKKSVNWVMIVLVVGLLLIGAGVVGYYFYERQANQPEEAPKVVETTTLNYWGLWEPTSTLTQVLKDFEAENPGVSVRYEKKNIEGYRTELSRALQTGNGPDLFRYHASWRSMLEGDLDDLPTSMMSPEVYTQMYYPVVSQQLIDDEGNIKGLPLMYDSLALLYNKDIFREAGLETPKTWPEFGATAMALTISDETGYIEQAGAAFGLSENVDFYSDIIGLLALQEGADLINMSPTIMEKVVSYYTDFYKDPARKVWDKDFDNSTLAFARGEVAMIFGPSWLIHDILKVNPNLNIGVASVPQLNVDNPVEWATYWVEGVNTNSPRAVAAWRLLMYLNREDVQKKLHEEQSGLRAFGEIYARRDMADLLAQNSYTQPYLVGAMRAQGFPLNDKTFDSGINQANNGAVAEVITNVINRGGNQVARVVEELPAAIRKNLINYGYIPDPRAQ